MVGLYLKRRILWEDGWTVTVAQDEKEEPGGGWSDCRGSLGEGWSDISSQEDPRRVVGQLV